MLSLWCNSLTFLNRQPLKSILLFAVTVLLPSPEKCISVLSVLKIKINWKKKKKMVMRTPHPKITK